MIGYQTVFAGNILWRRHHHALVPLQMPHTLASNIDQTGLRRAVLKNGCLFCRWEASFDEIEAGEWWHVIRDEPEMLEKRGKKTRNQIRRGAKEFQVELTGADTIISEGYDVYIAAFSRYETSEPVLTEKIFHESVQSLPEETEFWSVREKGTGKLVAFSENLVRDNACFYVTMWFCPDAMKRYAGYLLIFEMNRHYLNERRMKYVSDGARSLSHQTNIHQFLMEKFGFRRAYASLQIIYAPGFDLFIKLLYPFRDRIKNRTAGVFQKISILLEQERIRRSFLHGEQ